MPRNRQHGGFQKNNTVRKDSLEERMKDSQTAAPPTHLSDHPPYPLASPRNLRSSTLLPRVNHHIVQDAYFIGRVSSLEDFLQDFNYKARCRTKNCRGKFICVDQRQFGLGGGLEIKIVCSGCSQMIMYHSSPRQQGRDLAGYVAMLVSFLAGGTYADYTRTFGPLFGNNIFSHETFRKMVHDLHEPIQKLLDWEVEIGRNLMKKKSEKELGSWARAVTSSDGCYHVRGHFSLNMSLIVVDYFSGFTIGYLHQCSKGAKPDVDAEENWKGTAKAAEAYGAGIVFEELKKAGMMLEINVQDHDSSSMNRIQEKYPLAKIIICFGHHNRAFGKAVEKLNLIRGPECLNIPGGCIPKSFVIRAKTNHLAIAKESDGSPSIYSRKVTELGRYHARGIHQWEDGGRCSHPIIVCSCDQKCPPGKANPLICLPSFLLPLP